MKRIVIISLLVAGLLFIYLSVKRLMPYEEVMQKKRITLDSINVIGPLVWVHDKTSNQNFWLKSYTSLNATAFDTLQNKSVEVHYMKVFSGPFENRIFKIEIDSVVVFDQVVDGQKDGNSQN